MTKRSKQIPFGEAEPGMVLAEDLLNPRGKVILPKGTALNENTLVSLARYEVATLTVQLSDEMAAAEAAAEREHCLERIARLFRNSHTDKAGGLLKQYATQFRMETE